MRRLGVVAGVLITAAFGTARSEDVPIVGLKLIVVDKVAVASTAKAVFVTKDADVDKGTGTDVADIEATLRLAYDSASGAFDMPQGGNWLVNSVAVAKYVNKSAPAGGVVRVSVVKPGALLRVSAKGLGDEAVDISAAPTGSVYVTYTLVNGGEDRRHCTQFNACVHKVIAGGSGYKLVCKRGSTADHNCLASTCATLGDRFVDLGLTVLDTCTNLEWEKKTTAVGSGVISEDLHDVDNRYSWAGECQFVESSLCQPNPAAASTCAAQTGGALGCDECGLGDGACLMPNGGLTTVWDWVNQLNAEAYAGHTDWRLATSAGASGVPTGEAPELEAVVDQTEGLCGGSSGACTAPVFGSTDARSYFSASTNSTTPIVAFVVNFEEGTTDPHGKFFALPVRAVRDAS